MAANSAVLELLLKAKDEASSTLEGLNTKIKSLESDGKDRFGALGGAMQKAGGIATASLTLPILGIGYASMTASREYNAAMGNVAALGLPTDRVNELKSGVQDLAIALGTGTGNLGEGLYQVISAFGDNAETIGSLELQAKAAKGGVSTVADALALTSAVTKGYGDTSLAAQRQAADLALTTVKLGQTTFPELAASIGRVTPLAGALGVKQEELFGVLATGTGVTGGAAEVSTQFRGILQSLMSPTEDMAGLLADLGYESGEAMLKDKGLAETIATITTKAKETNTPLQAYISSIEGQTLAMALAGPQAETFHEKLAAMSGAAGETERAFAAQTEGVNKVGFEMDQAGQRVTVFRQELGDRLAPIITLAVTAATPLLNMVTQLVGWFGQLPQPLQLVILAMGGLAAGAGPVLMFVGTLLPMLPMMAAGFGMITAALGPLLPVILGVTAAIAAGILIWKYHDEILHALGVAYEWLKDIFWTVVHALEDAWHTVEGAVLGAVNWVLDFLRAHWPLIVSIIGGPMGAIVVQIIQHWDTIKGAISAAVSFVKDNILAPAWSGIQAAADVAWRLIKAFIVDPFEEARDAIETAVLWLRDNILAPVWEDIKSGARDTWETVQGFIETPIEAARDTLKWILNQMIGFLNGLISGINSLGFEVPSWVPGIGGKGWSPSIPMIPTLDTGGIVTQPTMALLAANRRPEAVIPLEQGGALDTLADKIADALARRPTYTINASYRYQDERDLRDDLRLLALLGA